MVCSVLLSLEIKELCQYKLFFFNFTLYSAHSRIGRGNLLLRHSVHIKTVTFPTFHRILEVLRVELRNSTIPERGYKNMYLILHFLVWIEPTIEITIARLYPCSKTDQKILHVRILFKKKNVLLSYLKL